MGTVVRRRVARAFAAVTAAAALAATAILVSASPAAAIVDGDPVPGAWYGDPVPATNAYAFVGRLSAPVGDGMLTCTASLVRSDLALTATHCLTGAGPNAQVTITFGLLNKDRGGGEARTAVAAYTIGDAVGLDDGSRMALVKLDQPVSGISPVRLAENSSADRALWKTGTILTSVGWGAIYNGGPVSAELRAATVKIVDTAVSTPPSHRGLMKATPVHGYPWAGDSGGPLLAGSPQTGFVQVGVFEVYSQTHNAYYNRVGLKDWSDLLARV